VAGSFCVGTIAEGGRYKIAAVVWVQCKYLKGCLCGRLVLRGNNS